MDTSNMTPKDKMMYEISTEVGSSFIQDLRKRIIPEDFEDIIYMIRRAEYKRGKADGLHNQLNNKGGKNNGKNN